jgi:hypothetical protein
VTERDVKASKKTTINLFIDENIVGELKKEADYGGISLNAKVSSILTKHVDFYRHAEALEAVTWSPKVFSSFLELMDEDRVIEILTNYGMEAVESLFSHTNKPISLYTWIKYAYEGVAKWTGQFSFFIHYVDNERYINLVMDHKYGMKWSRILASFHSKILQKLLKCPVENKITGSTVILKIATKYVS